MTAPSIPLSICPPFEGVHLIATGIVFGKHHYVPSGMELFVHDHFIRNDVEFIKVKGSIFDEIPSIFYMEIRQDSWDKLDLLLDSSIAVCHAARQLAIRLGVDPGTTAPTWQLVASEFDGHTTTPAHYRLVGDGWIRVFTETNGFDAEYLFGDPRPALRANRNDAGVDAYTVHPWKPTTVYGITKLSPVEALAAAIKAIG